MLRALLTERFRLVTHREMRTAPSLKLVAIRPKLTPANPSERTNIVIGQPILAKWESSNLEDPPHLDYGLPGGRKCQPREMCELPSIQPIFGDMSDGVLSFVERLRHRSRPLVRCSCPGPEIRK